MTKKGYKRGPQSPEQRANTSVALKKFHKDHPDAMKEWKNTPEAIANSSASHLKAQNTPEVFELIQQYSYLLINKLRGKYDNLNCRCNDPNDPDYKYYGGRKIKNLFTSQLHFLNYVILDLGYDTHDKIKGLDIHRTNTNENYEPGNIEFLTPKEHRARHNNRRNNKS